jgi:hypothetical protein
MNPQSTAASSDRPRLVCRVVRQWSALSQPPHSGHGITCVDCRNYFAAIQSLETELRDHAGATRLGPAGDEFAQQIIQTVRTEASASMRAGSSSRGRLWTFGAAVAAAGVALLLALNFKSQPGTKLAAQPSSSEEAEVIVTAVQSLSRGLVDSVIPSAGKLVATNPLQEELGLVYSDMRSALHFVALNFLPTTAAAPAPQPARRG